MAENDWSRDEVEATVADYFTMLRDELAGVPINKAEHNERLRRLLQGRSKGSVEFKHANISAILTLYGYPYIDGYKPRFNFQALLEQVVLEYLDLHRTFFEPLVAGPVLNPTISPDPSALDMNRLVDTPPEAMRIPHTVWPPTARFNRFDFVARDAANRDLGQRGEEFVLEFERETDRGQNHRAGEVLSFQRHRERGPLLRSKAERISPVSRLQLRTGSAPLHAAGIDFKFLPP
jgi:hypothetical protein